MLHIGKEYHLGIKAFLIFLLRKTALVVIIIFIGYYFSLSHTTLVNSTSELLHTLGSSQYYTLEQISIFIQSITSFLYIISIIIFMIGFVISWLKYHFYTFTFEEHNLRVEYGILSRVELTIPYRQMQNININRSLLYQILGVSKVLIDSGGHESVGLANHTEMVIEPVDKSLAEEIRDMLHHRVGVQKVEIN